MIKSISLFLALRSVSRRHNRGFSSFISASSTLGIGLGVMVLIIVLSAMNGFEKALAERLLSIVPHAEVIAVNKPINSWRDSARIMQKNKDVLAVAPVIKFSGMLQKSGQLKGLEIRGVDYLLEQQVSDIQNIIKQGYWDNLKDHNSIIIGSGIAKKLNVTVGDDLQLLVSKKQTDLSGKFPAPVVRHVTVAAIFTFGGMIDDNLAYISLAHAQDIMGYAPDETNGIRIKVQDVFQAPTIIQQLAYQLDHYVYLLNWTYTQGHLFNDIQLVRMVMMIVLALVIAVASFNIVSTLIMVVNEKKGDIAILKTMGASSSTIMLSFIIQGMINGVVGSLVGGALGVYLALNLSAVIGYIEGLLSTKFLSNDIYFIDYIPSELVWSDVYITVSIALGLSLIATIYPAWRATKVEPAQILGQL